MRLGRRSRPIVVGVAETVQRRSEQVVKLIQVARRPQSCGIKQTRMLGQLAQGLGFHGFQEQPGVDQPIKTLPDGPTAGSQINRR